MATSLRLPTAAELAGPYTLSGGGAPCKLTLSADATPGGHALSGLHGCADPTLSAVAAWRPAPDGLALTRSDRSLVLFLNRAPDGAFTAPGGGVTLKRAPAAKPKR